MTSGAKRVLVAGELNVDLILQGYQVFPVPGKEVLVDEFVMTLGSASAICAMGLARLGVAVAFLGVVGDAPGARTAWRRCGRQGSTSRASLSRPRSRPASPCRSPPRTATAR